MLQVCLVAPLSLLGTFVHLESWAVKPEATKTAPVQIPDEMLVQDQCLLCVGSDQTAGQSKAQGCQDSVAPGTGWDDEGNRAKWGIARRS